MDANSIRAALRAASDIVDGGIAKEDEDDHIEYCMDRENAAASVTDVQGLTAGLTYFAQRVIEKARQT